MNHICTIELRQSTLQPGILIVSIFISKHTFFIARKHHILLYFEELLCIYQRSSGIFVQFERYLQIHYSIIWTLMIVSILFSTTVHLQNITILLTFRIAFNEWFLTEWTNCVKNRILEYHAWSYNRKKSLYRMLLNKCYKHQRVILNEKIQFARWLLFPDIGR